MHYGALDFLGQIWSTPLISFAAVLLLLPATEKILDISANKTVPQRFVALLRGHGAEQVVETTSVVLPRWKEDESCVSSTTFLLGICSRGNNKIDRKSVV